MCCTRSHELNEPLKQKHGKGQEGQAREPRRPPFVVTRQPANARDPSETALHRPAVRHEHEALLDVWWQVVRQQPPRRARPDKPAPSVDDVAQTMETLGGLFGDEG